MGGEDPLACIAAVERAGSAERNAGRERKEACLCLQVAYRCVREKFRER